jgi:hypothetical protein
MPSDDDEWPPKVGHNPAIKIGDGARWHYRGTAAALMRAGVLEADETPAILRANISGGRFVTVTESGSWRPA